jgi:hypothetical protein
MKLKCTGLALLMTCAVHNFALAEEIPGDCLASFKVKPEKVLVTLDWTLGSGANAAMTCSAGELLREKLFVEGSHMLKQSDLSGTPTDQQKKAAAAYDDMEKKIQALPGEDTPGTLFSALSYLYTKYQLASCILTIEAQGGTCWLAVAKFLGATSKFFQKLSKNESDTLRKQDLLTELKDLKPTISKIQSGKADAAGSRDRWVRTQTQLCRAIQKQCL